MRFSARRICLLLCLLSLLLLTGCSASPEAARTRLLRSLGKDLGFDLSQSEVICIYDTHGGFHGDGLLAACLRPDAETSAMLTDYLPNRYWLELPITDEAHQAIFEWSTPLTSSEQFANIEEHPSGRSYGVFPEDGFPDSQQGCWIFYDKQSGEYSDSRIFDEERGSYNFWCAWFDKDTGLIYFIEFDT